GRKDEERRTTGTRAGSRPFPPLRPGRVGMAPSAAPTPPPTEAAPRGVTGPIPLRQAPRRMTLAQGLPALAAPPHPKLREDAACGAIQDDLNQYAIAWGSPALREGIAAKVQRFYGVEVDPEREITVCCGATETMISALLSIVNPGDEVIVMSPYYENYWPDA